MSRRLGLLQVVASADVEIAGRAAGRCGVEGKHGEIRACSRCRCALTRLSPPVQVAELREKYAHVGWAIDQAGACSERHPPPHPSDAPIDQRRWRQSADCFRRRQQQVHEGFRPGRGFSEQGDASFPVAALGEFGDPTFRHHAFRPASTRGNNNRAKSRPTTLYPHLPRHSSRQQAASAHMT